MEIPERVRAQIIVRRHVNKNCPILVAVGAAHAVIARDAFEIILITEIADAFLESGVGRFVVSGEVAVSPGFTT